MMLILVIVVICSIVVFPNVLIYTVSLLIVSISLLFFMVYMNYIRTLVFLLIVIVYVGAIIVLIGYVCAICPNFITAFYSSYFYFLILFSFFYSVFFLSFPFSQDSSKLGTLLDYFFSLWGSPVFFIVALMLFITLIIVTSQYSSPQGPFRSS